MLLAKGPDRIAYSFRELAALSGMTKRQVARLVESNGVPTRRTGNKRLVFLSDLKASLPELTDSIRFRKDHDDEG